MEIDITKVMSIAPKTVFDAIDNTIKAEQNVLEALHIIQSAIDFPELVEEHQKRMYKYLDKFCK